MVKIQGAKNSAMKHVFIPLITNDKYNLKMIPRISTINKLLKIVNLQGGKTSWTKENVLEIDTRNVSGSHPIPEDLFYNTSGGINPIPIIASRFGKCEVEINPERKDRGGDQIGSRNLEEIIKTLRLCGIATSKKSNNILEFKLIDNSGFVFDVPVKSFSATIIALFSALFKKGRSIVKNPTTVAEFSDIINFLISAGAKIKLNKDELIIEGQTKLKGVTYENMPDVNDFITFLSAALATNSELKFLGIDYKKMKLDALMSTTQKMNIQIEFEKNTACVFPQLNKIKPTKILAGTHPLFVTEWQVLFSPLLTQIRGESEVIETLYANRMQHWNEMKKMGANFKFFIDPNYPEVEKQPRAVKVVGPQELHGSIVNARDVRTGAALVISGLIAKGKTEILEVEHLERGYENLVGRFKLLGADIKLLN